MANTDVAFTYFTDTWTDAVQRGLCFTLDRCIVEATQSPDVGKVLVANAPRNAAVAAVRRIQGHRSPPLPASDRPTRLTRPHRVRLRDPRDVEALRRTYRRYERHVARVSNAMGLSQPVVITANPFVAAFGEFRWARSVTYYGYDDWAALPALEPWWPAIEAAYERIGRSGRIVAAVSQPIIDRIVPVGLSAVIPNGVEPSEWEPPWAFPPWANNLARPTILYVGSIGRRLDLEMIRSTAERVSEGELLFVGWIGDPDVADELSSIPKVRIHGLVGREQVAALVHAADVCIMPHRADRLTEAMSPLKLYEYLASGRPVVATDLPPVREVDSRVSRIKPGDAEGFARAVVTALATGPVDEENRRRFVDRNSWTQRFSRLLELATASGTESGG